MELKELLFSTLEKAEEGCRKMEKKLAKKRFICYYTMCMGHWRSWERATLAVWRSRVRIPYAPFCFS